MAFCSKCGTQVAEGVKFCPSCGNNVAGTSDTQQAGYTQANNQTNNQANNQGNYGHQGFGSTGPAFMNTADTTAQYNPADIADNKVLAILSYIGLLWLIPFFAGKHSPFTKFHVKQAFIVVCAQVGWSILGTILRLVIRIKVDLLWSYYYETPAIVTIIVGLVHICIWAVAILGIVNAAQGKAKELPIIGKFANKFTFLN
jgi:uncharacterized membrane protein